MSQFLFRSAWLSWGILLAVGCKDPAGPAWENQSVERATGWFAQFATDKIACLLTHRPDDSGDDLDVDFLFDPDKSQDVAQLTLAPLFHTGQRFQQRTGLRYGCSMSGVGGAAEIERGAEIVNPVLEGEARASAIAVHTNYYFPLTIHSLRLDGGRICNASCVYDTVHAEDCITVDPDSSLTEAHLWCSVGALTNPEASK